MHLHKVIFSKNAGKDLEKLSVAVQKRIKLKLKFFLSSSNPLQFATSLSKPTDAQYRWRVGDYRVLFDQLPDGSFAIIKIPHRKEVYKR